MYHTGGKKNSVRALLNADFSQNSYNCKKQEPIHAGSREVGRRSMSRYSVALGHYAVVVLRAGVSRSQPCSCHQAASATCSSLPEVSSLTILSAMPS